MKLGIFTQKIVAPHILFSFFLKVLVGGRGNQMSSNCQSPMQLFLSPSHATLPRKFERNVTRQTQLRRRHQTVSPIYKQGLSMGRGLGDLCPPPPVFCPKKSKHASKKVENKNSSPRALKQNVYSISKYVIPDKLQFTIEPPLTTNSLQQPLFKIYFGRESIH